MKRLRRSPALVEISERRGVTPPEVALAWLLSLSPGVMPIPGATRAETAESIVRAATIELDDAELARIEEEWGVPRSGAATAPQSDALRDGEVVLVMGMPGAGKSTVAAGLVAKGYERLNRDERGGSLSDLVDELERGLAGGSGRWVLDNTYASRKSRAQVIECAARFGVRTRCIWVDAGIGDAQIRAIGRLIDLHGRLPTPEEVRAKGKSDPRFFGPDAQFRYERTIEAPVEEEGFTSIERLSRGDGPESRDRNGIPGNAALAAVTEGSPQRTERALLLEYDGVLVPSSEPGRPALRAEDVVLPDDRREALRRYAADGWLLFAHAWRPQIGAGEISRDDVERSFVRAGELLGLEIAFGFCPHPAGPPICWCRKPIPGLVLEFSRRSRVDLARSLSVGRAAADRTMAGRLGVEYRAVEAFFRRA